MDVVRELTTEDFVALHGYEWTLSQKSCASAERPEPDYNHKIVLLPPGTRERCDSPECRTPDELATFMRRVGALGFTPHPWRFRLIDAPEDFPSFITRDYFAYAPAEVWIGAEVGPDFLPIPPDWAWPVVCEHPDTPVASQTVTLPEWAEALADGHRLAALATSDRHFAFVDFTQRTTLVYARDRSAASIFEALRARRTQAAHLEPFELHFEIGGVPVGATARRGPIRLRLRASPGEVRDLSVVSPDGAVATWVGDEALGTKILELPEKDGGPFWVEVYGHETDPVVGTPRTLISSPIWVER